MLEAFIWGNEPPWSLHLARRWSMQILPLNLSMNCWSQAVVSGKSVLCVFDTLSSRCCIYSIWDLTGRIDSLFSIVFSGSVEDSAGVYCSPQQVVKKAEELYQPLWTCWSSRKRAIATGLLMTLKAWGGCVQWVLLTKYTEHMLFWEYCLNLAAHWKVDDKLYHSSPS